MVYNACVARNVSVIPLHFSVLCGYCQKVKHICCCVDVNILVYGQANM